jgi:hypothetical protein
MIWRIVIGLLLAVAVNYHSILTYSECTSHGNYFTRCLLRLEKL